MTAIRPLHIRAEGTMLTLTPALINNYGQKIYIAKHPESWKSNYSVWADCGKRWSRMLVSHHRTRDLATKAANRLRNKNVLRVLGWVK